MKADFFRTSSLPSWRPSARLTTERYVNEQIPQLPAEHRELYQIAAPVIKRGTFACHLFALCAKLSGVAKGGDAQDGAEEAHHIGNLRKRREGSSAELSDTRRRGSSYARRSTPRSEEVVFNRRSIATRNAAKATGATTRGAGARPKPVAGATNTRGAMGGKFRRRQPGTPKPIAAGCAGLRPDGVYAYAKNIRRVRSTSREAGASAVSHGHAGRPSGTGRTVAGKLAAR